jgi:hypothetical protein
MDVPDKYIDLIYAVPFNEVHWVTQKEFDSDFQGLVPEVKEWIGAKCTNGGEQKGQKGAEASLVENINTSVIESQTKEIRCWMQIKSELSNDAWTKIFSGR